MLRRIAPLLTLLLLFFAACTEAQQDAADDFGDATEAALDQQMRDFQASAASSLADVDRQIEALAQRADAATGALRAELDAELAELRDERQALQADLARLDDAGEAAFRDVRQDVTHRLDEIDRQLAELEHKVERAFDPEHDLE